MSATVIAGRYRLDDVLGRSGMSEVWRAKDLELGRDVAIKLLAPEADSARFDREARAVASLAHPNITQVYDYGDADGRPYMVLEYVPGGTLETRLQSSRPLPDDETRAIAAGVAAGLAHAHARGVIHRDLKPANILFDEDGRPKLADFGIARMAAGEGTLTEAGTLLGTAAYISPEQAVGEPASAASDVYSFGVILYRMLTGRLPFESTDPMELVMHHRRTPPPPIHAIRDDAPAALESTAMAALAKDPADRPDDGTALLADLGVPAGASLATATTMLSGPATQILPAAAAATPTGVTSFPAPPPDRRRTPLIIAALAVIALGGGALAYAVTRPPSPAPAGTTIPSTASTKEHTTSQTTTTAPSTSTTQGTTQAATTATTTTARPPTTTAPPPPTTTTPPPPTTTAPPPTTTAPPPTTTAPPPTTAAATT